MSTPESRVKPVQSNPVESCLARVKINKDNVFAADVQHETEMCLALALRAVQHLGYERNGSHPLWGAPLLKLVAKLRLVQKAVTERLICNTPRPLPARVESCDPSLRLLPGRLRLHAQQAASEGRGRLHVVLFSGHWQV